MQTQHQDIFRQLHAQAIWPDCEKKPNRYVQFQTEFEADGTGEILFYICADTKYELYINGRCAGFGQYEDYPHQKAYDTYDVTANVIKGRNLVSILAYSQGMDSFQHRTGLPMVIFAAASEGKCLLASGKGVKCREAGDFIGGETELLTPQRAYNFGFDLRFDDGWRENNVSGDWNEAGVRDDSQITYVPRPNRRVEITGLTEGTLAAQGEFAYGRGRTVSEKMQYAALSYRDREDVFISDGGELEFCAENVYWIIDLAEETAGYITLDIEAENGAVLDIACGEHLADLRVRSYVGGRNFGFRCTCREGRQQLSFYIKRMAGRYLQFFAHRGIRKVYRAGLLRAEYPLGFIGEFHCSDRLFNRIYEVSARTLTLCMHEHYEDCPMREQALYAMDGRNQMLAGYYAFGELAMPRSSLALLAMGQRKDALLGICAPAKYEQTIPCFSLAWITALKEYVLFSGDLEFARGLLPCAREILNFFMNRQKGGLVCTPQGKAYWNFYEWTDGMDSSTAEFDAPLNAFFLLAGNDYAALCRWLGEEGQAQEISDVCTELLGAFHHAFYCPEEKVYQTFAGEGAKPHFAQLTQALALLAGCVPEEEQTAVRAGMMSEKLVAVSLSHLFFKYDALLQDPGRYGAAVLDDVESQWGYMLYHGATSFWETIAGEADFNGAGSLCHGWSAVPAYVFWRYLMGIYPTEPGFCGLEIKPAFGKIFQAEGTLKTPGGVFRASHSDGKTTLAKE